MHVIARHCTPLHAQKELLLQVRIFEVCLKSASVYVTFQVFNKFSRLVRRDLVSHGQTTILGIKAENKISSYGVLQTLLYT